MIRALPLLAVIFGLALGGCSASHGDAPTSVDGGVLQDPAFAVPGETEASPLRHWQFSQHVGEPSYELRFGNGMIRILRTGSQPWGILQQHMHADEWAGKTLEFSAELSGELDDRWGPPMQPTGLTVTVMGFGPQDMPMMGKRHLLVRESEPGLDAGSHDWQRLAIRFEVPEGRELELLVGLLLTRGGELAIRNPSLRVIED